MNCLVKRGLVYLSIISFLIACKGDQGVIGPSGLNSLVSLSIENAGVNCENGGIKIQAGVDKNANSVLDTDEVLTTNYVCNGANGKTSLTSVVTEPKGINCTLGGVKINSGVDINKNGTLENNEITTTAYVCNGINGSNGLTKLTNESAGLNCKNGGLKVDSGIDTNNNGVLDNSEITTTVYVCNGINGNNTLTKLTNETSGSNCKNGGLKIDSGSDANINGTLDNSEISSTAYICNGLDGKISLVNITDEIAGAKCKNGGVKITSGIDLNGNGTLDPSEIQATRYVCNGIDGIINEEIQLRIIDGIGSAANTSSSTPLIVPGLSSFDIRNFVNVDSVVFVSDPYVGDKLNYALLELYNVTDGQVFANTLIRTNNLFAEKSQLKTGNLFNEIPSKQITLGIKLSSETNGQFSASGIPYLFLYRSK
jgi:hypothetical protein